MLQSIEVIRTTREMVARAREIKSCGGRIGLVPTMGYLHSGHISLVRMLEGKCDVKMASIFVNPIQFRPGEDYEKYPRDEKRDLKMLAEVGCQIVYCPDPGEVYPDNYSTYIEVTGLQDRLCGKFRPGHFRGVATVVHKLFNITGCDAAVFGLKDYQQAMIIQRMARDLNLSVELLFGETLREADGLAMSSRNSYLSKEERLRAGVIPQTLEQVRKDVEAGMQSTEEVVKVAMELLMRGAVDSVQYVEVVHPETLEPVEKIGNRALLALAVYIGKTRLIDNIMLGESGQRKPICEIKVK